MEEKYRPLSPWAYFGYNLLFGVPIIGFVFLIIFSFNNKNLNRRNYARSFWIIYALAILLVGIALLLCLVVFKYEIAEIVDFFKYIFNSLK